MAQLYELIRQKYGSGGSSGYNKQKEIYNALGAPLGNYMGTAAQNNWLLNNQGSWDKAVAGTARKAGNGKVVATTQGQPGLLKKYANAVLPEKIYTPTPFEQLVPYESVVNPEAINNFAYSRVNPEVDRQKTEATRGLYDTLASTGGLRFGGANVKVQQLGDTYERMRKEMALPFIQQARTTLDNYLQELKTNYWKDPNAFEFQPIKPLDFLKNSSL